MTTTAENAPRPPAAAPCTAPVSIRRTAPNDPVTNDFARRALRDLLDRDLPHRRGRAASGYGLPEQALD